MMKEFCFGYDLENIEKVMNYVKENYKEEIDFVMWIERGEDVMNGLEVLNGDMLKDKKLMKLIEKCEDFEE